MFMCSYCIFMYHHRASLHSSATLTEVFPRLFLSYKANARVKPVKTGHGRHSSKIFCCLCIVCFGSFCVLFVCKCVLYCHRVTAQLRLTNISYHISYNIISYLIISYHISYHIMSCHVMSCHVTSYHILYHIMSCHVIP